MGNPPISFPISYKKRYRVEASSHLRKVKGKKRRKRIFVKAHYRSRWTIKFPRPILTTIQEKVFLKKLRKKPLKKVPKRVPVWEKVSVWIDRLSKRIEREGSILEIKDQIYHKKPATDVISRDGFIFKHPVKTRSLKSLGGQYAVVIRVWALVYHRELKRYVIWARARSYGIPWRKGARYKIQTYAKARKAADDIYSDIIASANNFDYMEVIRVLAWTLYAGSIPDVDEAMMEYVG